MQGQASVESAKDYFTFGGKDVGVLIGHQLLYHESNGSSDRFGSVILYKPTTELIPQEGMSEVELMRCLEGNNFMAFNPLVFSYIVVDGIAFLHPDNRRGLGHFQDAHLGYYMGILAHFPDNFNVSGPERVRISSEDIFFVGRGNVATMLPKKFGQLESHILSLGLEKITEEQFGEFIKVRNQ